jgi:hypothetical protein
VIVLRKTKVLDESDFFRKGEQEDVRSKSDAYIVMVSTTNAPDGRNREQVIK